MALAVRVLCQLEEFVVLVSEQDLLGLFFVGGVQYELVKSSFVLHQLVQFWVDLVLNNALDLLQLQLLLLQQLQRVGLFLFEQTCARGLFNQPEELLGLHVDDLRDAALHDEKVGVVHVELHRTEQIPHFFLSGLGSVDVVL